jgi:hypothetical protein
MTTKKLVSLQRLETSIAEFEAEFAAGETAPIVIANRFIHTLDAANLEERLAQLSPEIRALIVRTAKNNILTFDSIIAEIIRRDGYPGGWLALREWARRQPWVAEETKRAAEILARSSSEDDAEAGRLSYAEQGRMLGLLRVDLMRATTPERREAIRKEIEELEAAFAKANREAP